MKLGIALPQLGEWATPDNIVKVAQHAEELGYNSLWMQERLLWPINPKSPYPVTPDGSLPDQYQYVLDPIVTLAYAAASTKSIRIGTSVLVMPYHMPVMLAKQLATLDETGAPLDLMDPALRVQMGWGLADPEQADVLLDLLPIKLMV